jgi:tRNA(Ile)-lysidine synthetase-like protein
MNEFSNYKEVINFWFGYDNGDIYDNKDNNHNKYNEFWFDKSKDSYIVDKYSQLLHDLEENTNYIREYIKDKKDINNELILCLIIILDQFSRSIYRNIEDREKIKKNDKIALELSSLLLELEYDKKVSLPKRIFILMPYRHQKRSDMLDFVMMKIKEYKKEMGSCPLLSRFKKATLMSYTPLIDRIYEKEEYKERYREYKEYKEIIDENCYNYIEDLSNKEYIKDIFNNSLYKTLKTFVKNKNIKNIGVSLSGGVDSMVILYILSIINKDDINNINIYAMHIEYCNREESCLETEFISKYCSMLNIPLYIRKINYMSRESVDRNFYEEETKKIRFSTYRYLSNKHFISGWCLGHHKGDISENVLMNIYNGRNLLDLTVMKDESIIDKIKLYRPFLDHQKIDIYNFAHRNFIPYLKDTTPDWSCRGVIRRKLIPVIKDQWPMLDKNLFEIGKQSEELDYIFRTFVLEPLKKDIIINKDRNIIDINVKEEKLRYMNNMTIWLNLFLYVFHEIGINMISHKNLNYFIETFSRNYEKKNRFIFSNGCIGIFMDEKIRILRINI